MPRDHRHAPVALHRLCIDMLWFRSSFGALAQGAGTIPNSLVTATRQRAPLRPPEWLTLGARSDPGAFFLDQTRSEARDVCMGNRHRKRIRRVGTRQLDSWQQHLEHGLHLRFFRAAGADKRFFD
jgi:hypothetical protein